MNLRKIKSLSIVVAFALPATTLIPFGSAIAAIAWSTKAPIPTPRVGAAAAEVNGKIYVIGGYGGGQVTGTVEEYDPATNTWTTKTPMPTPRYAVVATVNGKIYAIGSQHYWPYNNPVEEYDPVADTWIARAPMPTVRFRLGTAVVNGKIYAIGGEDPRTGSSVGTVEEYNPTTDTWTTRASMPTPRYDLGVIAVNGKIYAIGGAYPYLNTVEEYDPVADTWTAKAPMIDGRYQHSVVTVSGKVYAIGGLTLNGAFSAETYDPVTNTWSPETPPSTPRYAAAAAAINNKIYITGGWPYNGNDPVAVTEEGIVGVDNIAPTSAALVSGTLALGTTTCVSLSSTGEQGNGYGSWNTINADGRYVAFMSYASNLVPDDTNSNGDIFVRDRLLSTTTRVSVSSTGVQANGYSGRPAISADGRYVAFWSAASNLVPDDTNSADDIFVHDRLLSTTTRVSVSSTGVQANGYSGYPVISADGRYVAFSSHANNLVDGDTNAIDDIFVRDLQAGTTRRVSISSTGEQGNGNSIWHAISADGRYVAFSSDANNLVDGDTNAASDIFVHDVQAGATKRVSVLSTGEQTNGYSSNPSISADGSYVAFSSDATNLVDGDTNSTRDVFVRNLQTGSTKRVSISSTRGQGNGWSDYSSISADGRYIVFKSAADNLILGDTNRDLDAFVQDQMTGETMRVNVSSSGAEGNRGHRGFPSISANGRYVVFASDANNLVDNDTNGQTDVFVHDRLPVPRSVTNLDGALVQNNWFSSNVTVALSATDTPGGSGVARTQYSFNGSTWDTYTVPFLVSAEGTTTVFYRSVDNAGNVEATKQQIIKIDKTAPTVSTTIVSANVNRSKGQVAQVNVSANEPGTYHVDIYRNLGGGARGAKVYSADLGEVSSIIWDGKDNAGAYVSNGGYLMSIIATDRAGNTTTISDISISVNNNP